MLNVSAETVCRLVELAQTIHVQEPVSIPEEPFSPADDWAQQMLADHADNPASQEFRELVKDLDPDQQQEVVALLWLGRGDFTMDDWDAAVTEAEDRWSPETADYLLLHPMLADHLMAALELHGQDCQEGNFLNPQ